jgi:hypothetical protein
MRRGKVGTLRGLLFVLRRHISILPTRDLDGCPYLPEPSGTDLSSHVGIWALLGHANRPDECLAVGGGADIVRAPARPAHERTA